MLLVAFPLLYLIFFFFCLVFVSLISVCLGMFLDFPGDSDGNASAWNMGDQGSIPGLGRSPAEGNGNPFQYSCLENTMDRGAW